MGETSSTSILRRKAADGRTEHQARAMTPTKALRLGMALSAEKGMDLALDVTKVSHTRLPHRALQATLDDQSLLAILEGQNGEPGAMAMDMQVLAGLVEHQTLGQVIPTPVSERVPTKVDAALITPFMEDALMRFVRMLGEEGEPPYWLQHYKFGAMTMDTRTLSLAMTAQDYHMFVLDVTVAKGKKSGTMALIFPDIEVLTADAEEDELTNVEKFQSTVKQATTTLNVVVGRLKMPISAVQGLQVGEMLQLPDDPMASAQLESLAGEQVAEVKLGQLDGMRAICVPSLAGLVSASDLAAEGQNMPDMPAMPDMGAPDMPALPDMGGGMEAELPAMGGMPDMDLGGMPDLDAGGLPDLGGGGLPDLDDGGLPDLGGDLPDLGGELPDLGGDLPDLPDMSIDIDSGGEDFSGLDDLDELIELGSDDIGDPMALADLT